MANIAVIVDNEFEDSEYQEPARRLQDAGHRLTIVGTRRGAEVEGKQHECRLTVECTPQDLSADDFDALLIPGGYSPDRLRVDPDVVSFVKAFHNSGKLIAAVCHGPSLLVDAEVVRGHRLTSWPSIRQDLSNAGGSVMDEEVVVDGNLITSRRPDDLPAFCDAILAHLS